MTGLSVSVHVRGTTGFSAEGRDGAYWLAVGSENLTAPVAIHFATGGLKGIDDCIRALVTLRDMMDSD